MQRMLYLDCLSGISGDMTLGALIDLGVPEQAIRQGIDSLGLPDVRLKTSYVKKCGFRGISLTIEHPEQRAHRHLHHIEDMIDRADAVDPAAKDLAKRIFQCIGQAEAKVHGSTIRQVHFHEVGAIDSICDIVGVAIGITQLGVDHVTASKIPTGTGFITIDHGRVSIPAPATIEILCGVPLAACDIESELTTPTGAAIVKTLATRFGEMPAMTPLRVGYGAGTRDLVGQANVLRAVLGDVEEAALRDVGLEHDRVMILETNLDDCTAEQIADVAERLMTRGALDVWQSPCVMKKGRAGIVLSVICANSEVIAMEHLLFTHTTTIGIRRQSVDRSKLSRTAATVHTALGSATGKVVRLPDGTPRFTLEHDEAKRIAETSGKSIAQIHAIAQAAWQAQTSE